ncbi:hypothetical protein Q7C36_011268 [Tachysurus vachellii]|uniref:Uncharacterized protein n=1 Tax=Tachysurus vachellii TaxID=175792 RepID=A0AA88MTR8_TACVA|nr:hypothetical protein Q7C36_011268 [Tachysurus vachellii]
MCCGGCERKCTSESGRAISERRKPLIEITDWQCHQVQASFQSAALEEDVNRASEGFIFGQATAVKARSDAIRAPQIRRRRSNQNHNQSSTGSYAQLVHETQIRAEKLEDDEALSINKAEKA